MSGVGEREDAPEIENEDGPEVEQEVEETSEDTEGEEEESEPEVPAESAEGEQPAVAAKPRSAATIAVQTAKRAAKEASEKADRLERELNEFRQQGQRAQTAEDQRLERERVALMAPEEKTDYLLGKQQKDFNARFGALEFRMHDAADRSAFAAQCTRVPAYAAIESDVEAALAQARREGNNPNREVVAKYLIGERAVAKALGGGSQRQKSKGRENIARNTTKPTGGRSDVARTGARSDTDSPAARRARLEDQQL